MAFEGGLPTRVFNIPIGRLRWTSDGRSLLYGRPENGVSNIWSQPIAGGSPKQLTHFRSGVIGAFNLSRDGKQWVMQRDNTASHVMLIRDVK
jgi:Tol biopolymer transport system component